MVQKQEERDATNNLHDRLHNSMSVDIMIWDNIVTTMDILYSCYMSTLYNEI